MKTTQQHNSIELARLMYRRMVNAVKQENQELNPKYIFLPDFEDPKRCFEHNGVVYICHDQLLLAKWHIKEQQFIMLKNKERSAKYYQHKILPLWQQNQANTKS